MKNKSNGRLLSGGAGLGFLTWLAVPVLFLAVLYSLLLLQFGWFYMASDDSYIYLGYVRMFVEHGSLYSYNVGQHSAGTTGILYYYVLSLGGLCMRLAYWPDAAAALTLMAYLLNGLLFIFLIFLVGKIWRVLSDSGPFGFASEKCLLISLVLWSPKFLWGWFAGLENPLTGSLVLLLMERCLVIAPSWQIALVAAALSGCRPELLPINSLVVAFTILRKPCSLRGNIVAVAAFALLVIAIYLPCWLLTGSLTPSALDSRISIPSLGHPLLWVYNVLGVDWAYLANPWVCTAVVLWLVSFLFLNRPSGGIICATLGFCVLYFIMRAALEITNFNDVDRYVSYLWPVYAIALAFFISQGFKPWAHWVCSRNFLVMAGVVLFYTALKTAHHTEYTLAQIIAEMNQVVVEPSRWMAKNLPPGSTVAVEPAGAIRVFTDFKIVDNVGLTTQDLKNFKKSHLGYNTLSVEDYLLWAKVDYVFDYPTRLRALNNGADFRLLKLWSPTPQIYSLGKIGAYKVLPN